MTEEQVQRLRDAGISDEVIVDMMKKDTDTKSEGYIDPATPSSTFNQALSTGTPTAGPEQSWAQTGTEAAMLVPDALKYAGGGALGYYGLKKLGQAMGPKTPGAPMPAAPVTGPAVPNAGPQLPPANTPEGIKQTLRGAPVQPGTNPYTPPQAPAQGPASMVDRIRQIAASRVLPAAKVLGGVGAMMYSPSLNTGEAEQLAEYRRRTGQQP